MISGDIQGFFTQYKISCLDDLTKIILEYGKKIPVEIIYKSAEILNPNRESTAAYYTDSHICNVIFEYLPTFELKKQIRILEPSVGAGRFLPFIADKYKNKEIVEITLIDIDNDELKLAELIFETYYRAKYPNIAIRYWNDDYLKIETSGKKYDLIIGNPPFDKLRGSNTKLLEYRRNSQLRNPNNLFVFFLEKAIREAFFVSLVVPKSLLNAPEYKELRDIIDKHKMMSIIDFGEKGFRGVKIETINLIIDTSSAPDKVQIYSLSLGERLEQEQKYITDQNFPSWLIYRNKWFDNFVANLDLNIFTAFRDRQIVNSMLSAIGKYRVLKSRNIDNGSIRNIEGYDTYCDEIDCFHVSKYLNKDNIVCVPNLSYCPRATILPKDTIVNGSVALLELKDKSQILNKDDLAFFATDDFAKYYRVARNYGTRSLNIDASSVFFFGFKKHH